WEALRGARLLIQAGRRDPPLISFARQACDESARRHTAQAWSEREQCLTQLARLADVPENELCSQRESMTFSLFSAGSRARGLAALVDEHPDQLLALLDIAVHAPDEIHILFDWAHESRS